MFTFVLPRFFGFAPGHGGRDDASDMRARRGGRPVSGEGALPAEPPRTTDHVADAAHGIQPCAELAGRPVAEVLETLRTGDIEHARVVFAAIYQEYFETLWHFAYRHLRSAESAKELVHDVFLSLWIRRTALDIQGDLGIYLRSAVRNRVYKNARHANVVTRMETAVVEHGAEPPAIGTITDPATALDQAEAERILMAALARLSPRDRDILSMRWIDRMTQHDIAAAFGISASRVRTILARATASVMPALRQLRDEPKSDL